MNIGLLVRIVIINRYEKVTILYFSNRSGKTKLSNHNSVRFVIFTIPDQTCQIENCLYLEHKL